MDRAADHQDNPIARLVAVLVLFGLSVAVFVRMMNYDMRRDEQLYVPPAELLSDMGLYSDFFYNHVPTSAWLFYAMHSLLPSLGLLLTSRLVVFGFWVLFVLAIYWLVKRLSGSRWLALLCVFAFAANELILTQAGMSATNNLMPLPLAFLGTGLFVLAVTDEEGAPFQTALAGFLLAFAGTIKASAVCFIPAIAIAAFLLPGTLDFSRRFRRVVLPLAIGGLIGALPVLIYLAAEPRLFLAHVVGFHTGPHVGFWENADDPNVAMGLGSSVRLAFSVWLSGAGAIAVFMLVWLMFSLTADRQPRPLRDDGLGLTVLLAVQVLIAALFGFVSTPSFPQYFVLPFAVLPLLLAHLYGQMGDGRRSTATAVVLAGLAVSMLIAAPRLLQHLPKLPTPEKWKVVRVHNAGEAISAALRSAGLEGKVATLLPVYVLEGGLPVYPELATGQFIYRIADSTSDDLLDHYVSTSPATVPDLLEQDPPAGLLLGFETQLEEPFLAFARANGYKKVPDLQVNDRYGTGVLYVRTPDVDSGS